MGIGSVPLFSLGITPPIALLVLFAMILFIITFNSTLNSYKNSIYYGCILFALMYCLGYWFAFKKRQYGIDHFSNELKNSTYIYVRIEGTVIEKEKSVKTISQIISVKGGNSSTVKEKVLIYFQKNEAALKLNYGDELILKNTLKEISCVKNPGEFDYKKFLANKNIHLQAFVKSNQWINTGRNTGNIFIAQSILARNRLLSILEQIQLNGDAFAVASALLVGYTDKLDANILSAYSQTGAMHILSVSGLHVGIVFMVLTSFLFFLDKFKYGLVLKAIILIFFLWAYAFISGLSPSVIRSATMFSFIVYGKLFKRNSTVYNTLAASALLMLLYDPFYVLDVGFQLSYIAVIGIVAIQPFFSDLIKTDNWMLHQLSSLVTVSIAAQLATFPISIYYFHQFPNFFLLTNLIAIPLSSAIIYLGILLMFFSSSPFIVKYLGHLFAWLVDVLNNSIQYISQLPYSITDGIFINKLQLIVMYVSIIFCINFLYKKHILSLSLFLSNVICLLVIQLFHEIKLEHQKKFIVYDFPKASAIDLIDGKQHVLYVDSINGSGTKTLEQYWKSLKLDNPVAANGCINTATVYMKDEFIQFYNKRIVILKDPGKTEQLFKKADSLKVDYALLSHNVKLPLEQIIAVYHPDWIVFDGSNKTSQVKKWEGWCIRNKQKYYSVMTKGALVVEF